MCNDCNDWKEILKEDVSKRQPGQGYGTRNMALVHPYLDMRSFFL